MKSKGAALISVVIILSVTFLLVAITVDRSLKSYRRTQETIDDTRAYYFAESLINDMAGYIDSSNNSAPKGTYVSNIANPNSIQVILDPNITDYSVTLISDIVKTYEDSTKVEYTYNIDSTVIYNRRNYTVKLQMTSVYTKVGANSFSGHRINYKRSYRL